MNAETFGTCQHCGQRQSLVTEDFLTQQELDELAAESCSCNAGAKLRFLKSMENTIESVIGNRCTENGLDYACADGVIDLVREIGNRLYDNDVVSVTLKEGGGDTIKLQLHHGKVQIAREHKRQVKM